MLPLCQLPAFLLVVPQSTFALFHFPSSLPESQHFKKHWHFVVKKDSGPRRSLGINTGLQKGVKAELTSRVFSALHSALQLTGCTAILAVVHRAPQPQSDGVSITAETLMRLLTGDTRWSLLFLCFYPLTSHESNQPEYHNKHSLCKTNEWKDFQATQLYTLR